MFVFSDPHCASTFSIFSPDNYPTSGFTNYRSPGAVPGMEQKLTMHLTNRVFGLGRWYKRIIGEIVWLFSHVAVGDVLN